MVTRIQHIDLELMLANQYGDRKIESDINKRFKNKVLIPLEKALARIDKNSFNTYQIKDITIEENIKSLSDLDRCFDNIRKKLKSEIERSLDRKSASIRKSFEMNSSTDILKLLVHYIENGDAVSASILKEKSSVSVAQEVSFKKLFKELTKSNNPWTVDKIVRLLDFYSYKEIIEILFQQTQNTSRVIKNIWIPKDQVELIENTQNTLDQLYAIYEKAKATTDFKHQGIIFYISCILLLVQNTGLKVEDSEIRTLVKNSILPKWNNEESSKVLLEKVSKKIEEPKQTTNKSESKIEQLIIENAGLFILHPFIARLFTKQNLLIKNEITDCSKALNLLHYLSTGLHEIPKNYELNTEKILIGLQPADTFLITEELSKTEIANCVELLEATINHWGALGNTSPQGLRELFINRSAVASYTKVAWKIAIEKKAQDILLDRMPWGLGIIKFPWMEQPIEIIIK